MADIRAFIQNLSVGRASSGAYGGLRMTPDGALYTADVLMSAAIEGRVFGMNSGVVTTPAQTAATTALTNTIPSSFVRVPDGTLIVPIYARLVVESSGATTQGEASLLIAQNDVGTGGGAAAGSGAAPINLNTASPVTSNCTPIQIATASTAPTNPLELFRASWAASAVNQTFEWVGRDSGLTPVVRGAGTWGFYIGGNAVNFFSTLIWAEFPETTYS